MRVKTRAVIWIDGQLIVAQQSRRGRPELSLPGGRVNDHESVLDALRREVAEETGLEVAPQRLLYVSEVPGRRRPHSLELIFLAEPTGVPTLRPGLKAIDLTSAGDHPPIRPAIVQDILADANSAWRDTPRWLGRLPVDRMFE